MQATIPAQYRLAPDVIVVPIEDGTARLLDMGGAFYALSSTGLEMMRGVLVDGVAATARAVADRCDVPPSRVEADLAALLAKLRKSRLVRRGVAPSWAARVGARLARLTARVVLPLAGSSPAALMTFARISFVLFGWARTVDAWSRGPRGKPEHAPDSAYLSDQIDQAIKDAAARLPFLACKERALCAWYLLCRERIAATLVVGIELFPLAGHCWCEVGPRKFTDFADRCEAYLPVARYGLGPVGLACDSPPAGISAARTAS
jgi:Transglutaminase-like superfamily